jgi:hypothetical protein
MPGQNYYATSFTLVSYWSFGLVFAPLGNEPKALGNTLPFETHPQALTGVLRKKLSLLNI